MTVASKIKISRVFWNSQRKERFFITFCDKPRNQKILRADMRLKIAYEKIKEFEKQLINLMVEGTKDLKGLRYLPNLKAIGGFENESRAGLISIYSDNLDEIINLSDLLNSFENVLFLGTGGSSLGGKTLVSIKENFFFKDTSPKVYFLENVDEWTIFRLTKKINLQNTALVVISKSGETIETLSQFFFLKNQMKEIDNFKKKVFIITENKKSTLKEIQEEEGFKFYEHKKNYSGRETQIHNYYLLIHEI